MTITMLYGMAIRPQWTKLSNSALLHNIALSRITIYCNNSGVNSAPKFCLKNPNTQQVYTFKKDYVIREKNTSLGRDLNLPGTFGSSFKCFNRLATNPYVQGLGKEQRQGQGQCQDNREQGLNKGSSKASKPLMATGDITHKSTSSMSTCPHKPAKEQDKQTISGHVHTVKNGSLLQYNHVSLLGHVSKIVSILLSKLSDCPSTVTTHF